MSAALRPLATARGTDSQGRKIKRSRRNFLQTLAASGGLLHINPRRGQQSTRRSLRRLTARRQFAVTTRCCDSSTRCRCCRSETANSRSPPTSRGCRLFPKFTNRRPRLHDVAMGMECAPLPAGLDPKALRLVQFDTYGRQVGYTVSAEGQNEFTTGCARIRTGSIWAASRCA